MRANEFITEAAIAIAMQKAGKKPKSEGVAEGSGDDFYAMALQKYPQLKRIDREIVINALNNAHEDYLMHYGYEGIGPEEESSMIDHAVKGLKQGVAEGENWSKHNNKRVGGMSKKSVNSYRRSHPGSKIQTAVTKKPSKIKKGSKDAKRRASFCARMKGMKKHRTSAKTARDPNSNINKSLRRWHCESVEQLQELVMIAEQYIRKNKK
jgi:hypothetical protein